MSVESKELKRRHDCKDCYHYTIDEMFDLCKRCQSALLLGRYLFSVFENFGDEANSFGVTNGMIQEYKSKQL